MASPEEFMERFAGAFERGWYTNDGPLVREFEDAIAKRLGVRHCVAMCNGTVALEIAIRATRMSGEVIVPSYTFVATAHALYWQGITPVFADIDPGTHTLDPDSVRSMITPRTTGIIGVHLWGRPAAIQELQAIADEHGLELIFDAAHSFGASYGGRPIGGFGRAEVFSFHATKFFNTFEGGAAVTDDDELAEAMRLMRNFGFAGYDNVIHPGTNGKMIEACAAVGLANLGLVEQAVAVNQRNHERYQAVLATLPGISLSSYDADDSPNFQYVVAEVGADCPVSRDEIVAHLHSHNVLARKYFWPGCHRMKPYRDLFPHAGLVLPYTEAVAAGVIVLPTGPSVSLEAVDLIGDVVSDLISAEAR